MLWWYIFFYGTGTGVLRKCYNKIFFQAKLIAILRYLNITKSCNFAHWCNSIWTTFCGIINELMRNCLGGSHQQLQPSQDSVVYKRSLQRWIKSYFPPIIFFLIFILFFYFYFLKFLSCLYWRPRFSTPEILLYFFTTASTSHLNGHPSKC